MTNEALLEKPGPAEASKTNELVFRHLPGYASFIKDNHLVPYIQEQLRISREINIPLMKFVAGIPDDQLIAMGMENHRDFLTAAENNALKDQIERSMQRWIADQLGIMKREEITAEDIMLAGHVRKKSLLKFLPSYTNDVFEAIEIIKEIDSFTIEAAIIGTNVYINLLKDRINEQTFFTEVLSNTTPGLNYILGLRNRKVKYANKNYLRFFGTTMSGIESMGDAVIQYIVHPDDLADTLEGLEKCSSAADEEVVSWEFRLKSANGSYVWMKNYASVFKKDSTGEPVEIVGIILDISKEKDTAEKLLLREKQLLDAQAQANVGSFELDVETSELQVTPQFMHIYEISGEPNRADITKNIHPDDLAAVKEQRDRTINEIGFVYDNEYRYLVNGKEKVIWARGAVSYKNGRKVLTGTVMDVTVRHKMMQQLRESEQLFKQAQAISHIGNWSWNMDTKRLDWSDEVYRIYELEPQSLNNSDTLSQYNHPDDEQQIRDTIRQAVVNKRPFDFNYRIVLQSGKIKTVHAIAEVETTPDGTVVMYGTLQDITEEKAAEKQIKDYQEFIEKITDVTPSIIAAYNIHTGKYSFINDAIENLLGYPTSRVMEEGVPFVASLVHPDDINSIMEKNAIALEEANKLTDPGTEPISEFKYRMKNKNGEYRWFHTYGTIFERNDKGLVESVLNISVDITEQERAEQALYQKNLQLQQSNTSLEEYAYVASHDLKEPLRKISSFTDRMLTSQGDSLNPEGKVYLNKIIDATKRMQNMIHDLLSVSTIMGNTAYEVTNLKTIFEEALVPLEHKIEENNAMIEVDELPVVSVVPSQFRQLFQNLISNSLKFSRSGIPSHIKISHLFVNQKAIGHFGLTKAKKYLQIRIEDNGIGFEEEYAAKIFAIFQRLHGKSEYEGTGIGLAICKKIVENHGGVIFAEGIAGKGATFTIIIPAMM